MERYTGVSCLGELTGGTYAMSGPVRPNIGLGLPRSLPGTDWRQIYRIKEELDQRWKEGMARPVYLDGNADSVYYLQFRRCRPSWPPTSSCRRNSTQASQQPQAYPDRRMHSSQSEIWSE